MIWKPLTREDTICAVSTPPGVGGISVVRVNGPATLLYLEKTFTPYPSELKSHSCYFGNIVDPASGDNIDEVVVTYFSKGKSYSGDETVEISCHGNPLICSEIINLFVSFGCRVADRGEFTYRAFMNGKIDLVQAESVLSLIHSQSKKASRSSIRQLKGDLSKKVQEIEDLLTYVLAHIEAGIDFTHEDIDINSESLLSEKIDLACKGLKNLVQSYKSGRVIQEGLWVSLLGEPNVGKSSLLNTFLGEEKAIVTEIAGTTRDTLEGTTFIKGYRVNFTDSAGIRSSEDKVEKIGIERALSSAQKSDVVFFVIDISSQFIDFSILDDLDKDKIVFVLNKSDLDKDGSLVELFKKSIIDKGFAKNPIYSVNSLSRQGLAALLGFFEERLSSYQVFEDSVTITQSRHFELLSKALASAEKSLQGLSEGVDLEFLALDLYEALISIKEVLGKKFDDDVMDRVFKDFCIGK